MSVWDNQQATKSWFAGILDGEGTAFTYDRCRVGIRVTNTDADIIGNCASFLTANFIPYYVSDRLPENPRWSKSQTIGVNGKNQCYTLIKVLGNSFQCRLQEFLTKLELGAPTTTRNTTFTPDLYWLIGFLEGEGCFCLSKSNRGHYRPMFKVENTKESTIQKFALTLRALGCSWTIFNHYPDENPKHKYVYGLWIKNVGHLLFFLRKIRGLIRAKKYLARANLLLEYCNSRTMKSAHAAYSEREHQIYQEFILLSSKSQSR